MIKNKKNDKYMSISEKVSNIILVNLHIIKKYLKPEKIFNAKSF